MEGFGYHFQVGGGGKKDPLVFHMSNEHVPLFYSTIKKGRQSVFPSFFWSSTSLSVAAALSNKSHVEW